MLNILLVKKKSNHQLDATGITAFIKKLHFPESTARQPLHSYWLSDPRRHQRAVRHDAHASTLITTPRCGSSRRSVRFCAQPVKRRCLDPAVRPWEAQQRRCFRVLSRCCFTGSAGRTELRSCWVSAPQVPLNFYRDSYFLLLYSVCYL